MQAISFLNMSGHADAHIVQYDEDVGRATGSVEVREDFISNLSRISQLTGEYCHERLT
jgi:coatomer subunit beta